MITRRAVIAIGAIGMALLLATPVLAIDARGTHVYTPRHRTAQELGALAEAVLGEAGVAVVDGSTIVLIGPLDRIKHTAEILEARDIPQRVVTLHLEARSTGRLRSAGHHIRWQTEGSLRAGRLMPKQAAARSLSTAREKHTGFSLRVRDGATGHIDVGRSVPVLARGFFGGRTTVIDATSKLLATPHVLGDGQVSVDLVWARRDVDDAGRTAFEGGSTTVVVDPGEVIVIGSLSRKLGRLDPPAHQTIGALSSQTRSDEQVILLRVEVD